MTSRAADQLLSHLSPPDLHHLDSFTLDYKEGKGETGLDLENISGTGGESSEQRTERERSTIQRISLQQSCKKSTQPLGLVLCQRAYPCGKGTYIKLGGRAQGMIVYFSVYVTHTELSVALKSSFYSSK